MGRAGVLIVSLALVEGLGCRPGPSSSSSTQPQQATAPATTPTDRVEGDDPRCDRAGAPTRLELELGQSAVAHGMSVTYAGWMHDNYADGRTDELLELTFADVTGPGDQPAPSTLTYTLSAYARPRFDYIPTGHCVRVVDAGSVRVVLDLADVPP